jgi:hypothetical protein
MLVLYGGLPPLRSWPLVLVALALAYALGHEFLQYERHVVQKASIASASGPRHPAPRAKPAPRPAAPEQRVAFGGYPCLGADCSEDKAGYRWAESHGIADPDDCTGRTGAFIEGCRVYARQQTPRADRY